ncbi:MAG: acyltransferase [Planctomycetaceae bacterium]
MTIDVRTPIEKTESLEDGRFEPSIKRRIRGLDELRGIAILSVMLAHFFNLVQRPGYEHLHLGGPGVDLFFIISGFLIAKILFAEKGRPGYFRRFYVRRIFRILPLYGVVVLTMCLAAVAAGADCSSWPFYVVFLQNFLGDPITAYRPVVGLGPLWSLAVEEQFYLVLPLVIFLFPTRVMPVMFAAVAAVGITLKTINHIEFAGDVTWGYSNPLPTWFRMQYLALGCLLAVESGTLRLVVGVFAAWLTGAVIVGDNLGVLEGLVAIMLFGFVGNCVRGYPVFSSSILAQIGKLCFGIYLFHLPILIALRRLAPRLGMDTGGVSVFLIYIGASILLAALSFTWFENPVQKFRTRFE